MIGTPASQEGTEWLGGHREKEGAESPSRDSG